MAPDPPIEASDIAIRIVDAHVSYGAIKALQGVNLDVLRGKVTALVGLNGAGKSSLLRAVVGLTPLSSGSIEVPAGQDVTRTPTHHRVRNLGLALVLENRGILTQMTVEENLRMGLRVGLLRRPPAGSTPLGLADAYGLFPILGERRYVGAGLLSGGEQQMLAIARGLLMEPDVLLVDEPSTGLAPLIVREIFERLSTLLVTRNLTVFLVEQNTALALRVSEFAYVLERGRVTMSGRSQELAADPRLVVTFLSA